jgi:hypothetical protein
MTPNIYKARVAIDIVVMGKDEQEAREAVEKHTFVEGATCSIQNLVQVNDISQLPVGWNGQELAFSKWHIDPWVQRSIASWLK